MKTFLQLKKLDKALTGTAKPEDDQYALGIIKLYCADTPLMLVNHFTETKAAWDCLEESYNPRGFTTEFITIKNLLDTTLESSQSMDAYVQKIKTLDDGLRGKGITMPEQFIRALVFHNLSSEYDNFVSTMTQAFRNDSRVCNKHHIFTSLIDESRGHLLDNGPT